MYKCLYRHRADGRDSLFALSSELDEDTRVDVDKVVGVLQVVGQHGVVRPVKEQRARQQFRHHRVVHYQRGEARELFCKALYSLDEKCVKQKWQVVEDSCVSTLILKPRLL